VSGGERVCCTEADVIVLPNPFENINPALASAMMAGPAAAPGLTDPPVAAAADFSSVPAMATNPVVAPNPAPVCPVAATGDNSNSAGVKPSPVEPAAVADAPQHSVAAVGPIPEPLEHTLPVGTPAGDTGGHAVSSPAVFPGEQEDIPVLFSAYARHHSLAKVSPPIKQPWQPDAKFFSALEVELKKPVHPRDLDLDPPPLFLRGPQPKHSSVITRKPRTAFLRQIFQLAGART
jgi:hypothetical protein